MDVPYFCYRSKFSVPARYREAAHTYRRIIESTIDPLLEAGCLYHVKGYFDRTRGVGKQSRLGLEGFRLLSVFSDVYVDSQRTKVPAVKLLAGSEVLILKDDAKDLIDYADTQPLIPMRQQINDYNDFMASQVITLNDSPLSITRMRRVFNNSSWECGGRYYGSWQNLPKTVRKQLSINGQQVVERDYSGFHMNMAYADATGDIYQGSCPYDFTEDGFEYNLYTFIYSSKIEQHFKVKETTQHGFFPDEENFWLTPNEF